MQMSLVLMLMLMRRTDTKRRGDEKMLWETGGDWRCIAACRS